ncbi:neuronal acetylcholine receptor subunit alpha-3-like [Orbicella faveolata]|uniref:neuronal acetylcholine receptor subunit alpha-3-like n=1 Tax=Orbicella faveolata TaxID=48498 RepID=UPI0009E5544C|nr:neuronal acetylcholine receptor subunit alpha-3-like [Orbicella faveolata]
MFRLSFRMSTKRSTMKQHSFTGPVTKILLMELLVILFTCRSVEATRNFTQNPHQRLLEHLFARYDRDGHPGGGRSVKVWVGAKVVRIVNIDEKNNALQAQWWMKQDWNNPDLTWNPKDYDGLTTVYVEPSKVWVPDVLLYNNVLSSADKDMDAAGALEKYKTKISVSYDGNNSWMAPAMFQSICKIDIKYFPFDEQHCYMKFASWAYDVSMLDVYVNYPETGILNGIYQPSNEWDLIGVVSVRNEVKYTCCPNPYSEVLLTLNLQRYSRYYIINLVFPCALIACMVFFTFVLPPECGERVSLCITILMAMTIFQELTSEKLPPSSDTFFLIGTYYTVAIFEIGLAIAATCIVLNFYYSKTKMPGWIKTVLLKTLAPLVRVKIRRRRLSTRESQRPTENGHAQDVIHNPTFEPFSHADLGLSRDWVGDVFEQNQNVSITSVNLRKDSISVDEEENSSRNINNAGKNCNGITLRNMSTKRKENTYKKETTSEINEPSWQQVIEWQDEWRAASQVLDRVIIITSVLVGCVSAAVIFLQAPRVRDMFSIS